MKNKFCISFLQIVSKLLMDFLKEVISFHIDLLADKGKYLVQINIRNLLV